MQIDRLLEIIMTLLSKENVTAKQLAEKFDVSTRTIYRDVDTLSLAGIPICSSKGNGGGISLMEGYTIDKSLITDNDQNNILFALQSLGATKFPDVENTLTKVNALFKKTSNTNWIRVDFSSWGSNLTEKVNFQRLKDAVIRKTVIMFEYLSSKGEKSSRIVEPLFLLFKAHSWYLYGYCRMRNRFRLFKISRIKDIEFSEDTFERDVPDEIDFDTGESSSYVSLKLKFDEKIGTRVYDEFDEKHIRYDEKEKCYFVKCECPFDDWLIGYLLSFGNSVEVVEPYYVRDIIKQKTKEILEKYD